MMKRRAALFAITCLAVVSIIGTAVVAFIVDRSQCRAAAQAIENSRTMWVYLVEQNPGAEADAFRIELDRRIPPAHCRGGTLIVDNPGIAPTTVPDSEP